MNITGFESPPIGGFFCIRIQRTSTTTPMQFLKSPVVIGILGFVAGAVVEKKFGIISKIPVVRDWLA